jgi:hypothetical protein
VADTAMLSSEVWRYEMAVVFVAASERTWRVMAMVSIAPLVK